MKRAAPVNQTEVAHCITLVESHNHEGHNMLNHIDARDQVQTIRQLVAPIERTARDYFITVDSIIVPPTPTADARVKLQLILDGAEVADIAHDVLQAELAGKYAEILERWATQLTEAAQRIRSRSFPSRM